MLTKDRTKPTFLTRSENWEAVCLMFLNPMNNWVKPYPGIVVLYLLLSYKWKDGLKGWSVSPKMQKAKVKVQEKWSFLLLKSLNRNPRLSRKNHLLRLHLGQVSVSVSIRLDCRNLHADIEYFIRSIESFLTKPKELPLMDFFVDTQKGDFLRLWCVRKSWPVLIF